MKAFHSAEAFAEVLGNAGFRRLLLTGAVALLVFSLGACGDDDDTEPDGGSAEGGPEQHEDGGPAPSGEDGGRTPPPVRRDGGGDGEGEQDAAVPRACTSDAECDNTLFCDGLEACRDGLCRSGEAPDCDDGVECTRDACSEQRAACVHVPPDRDGDGHADQACVDAEGESLGDDCDDDDPDRYPGNAEICPQGGDQHDEDCDFMTLGDRDMDGDGYVDSLCCNAEDEGESVCGGDCNDGSSDVHPDVPEVCDGFDNNCDGETDEGLTIDVYVDADFDTHGDSDRAQSVCPGAAKVSTHGGDCDDTDPHRNQNLQEFCDNVDNDCDGETDEDTQDIPWYRDLDGDGFGNPSSGIALSCEPLVGYSILPLDCDDLDADVNPAAPELCDALDNDCNGLADYVIGPGDFEDDDGDGSADSDCMTSRPDCDDDDASVYPGAPELCDGLDNDCNGVADTHTVDATWYRDEDGDGFGDLYDMGRVSCEVLPDRVTRTGDCDDAHPGIYPGAEDGCSGLANVDDDCDGVTDEDETDTVFFLDQDGDGYGGEVFFLGCRAPSNYTSVAGDCDDTDDTRAPDRDEVCELTSLVDDDCDGDISCADSDCFSAPECEATYVLTVETPAPPLAGWVAGTVENVTVKLAGDGGTPIEGATISFVAPQDAAVTPQEAVTAADGTVSVTLRLGWSVGEYGFAAYAGEAAPLSITAEALAPDSGTILTLVNATGTTAPFVKQEWPATEAVLSQTYSAVESADGTLYVSDYGHYVIYRISPAGVLAPIAGGNGADDDGDGGPAVDAKLYGPTYLALDEANALLFFVQSATHTVRAIDLDSGDIFTYAGGADAAGPDYGDGGSATGASLNAAKFLNVDTAGNLYIADTGNTRIRKVLFGTTTISTYLAGQNCTSDVRLALRDCAWGCELEWTADGGAFLSGRFCGTEIGTTSSVTSGVVHIADLSDPEGSMTLAAGQFGGGTADGMEARQVSFSNIMGIDTDAAGNLYLTEYNPPRVRWIDGVTGIVSTLAGDGTTGSYPYGDYGPAAAAQLQNPVDVVINQDGHALVVDMNHSAIRAVWNGSRTDPNSVSLQSAGGEGQVVPFTGQFDPITFLVRDGNDDPLQNVSVYFEVDEPGTALHAARDTTNMSGYASVGGRVGVTPGPITVSAHFYDIYARDIDTHSVELNTVAPDSGTISTAVNVDHSGSGGESGVPGPGTTARIGNAFGLAVASDDTVYFTGGHAVYRMDVDGRVYRVAGTGAPGFDGDTGPATLALLWSPKGLALDETENLLYIADTSNHRIRVVDLDTGIIQTFAGTGTAGTDGQGDGEHALDAALNAPSFLSLGPDGLYLASSGQHEIRWIDDAGIIQTLLTDGTDCGQELALRGCATGCAMLWAGDDSALISGRFCGTLFGATSGTAREAIVRRYSDGSFEHVAGEAGGNTTPSGPLAVEAAFTQIGGMALDSSQNLYLCEYNSHRVRMIDEDGRVQVVAGNGTLGDAGDFGPATDANLNYPGDIVFLADGRLLISDYSNYAIRTVWP